MYPEKMMPTKNWTPRTLPPKKKQQHGGVSSSWVNILLQAWPSTSLDPGSSGKYAELGDAEHFQGFVMFYYKTIVFWLYKYDKFDEIQRLYV